MASPLIDGSEKHLRSDLKEEGVEELLADMYSSCIQETRDRLATLISLYVDSEDILSVLMPVVEEVEAVAEEYERAKSKHGPVAAVRSLKNSFDFADVPAAPSASASSSSAAAAAPSAAQPPAAWDGEWQQWPLLSLPSGATDSGAAGSSIYHAHGSPPEYADHSQQKPQQTAAEPSPSAKAALDMVAPPEPDEPAEPLPDMDCPICMDHVKGDQCIRIKECGHVYCLDCLDDYLGVKVKDGKVLDLKCPNPTCHALLTYREVSRIITDEAVLQKYEEFLFLSALRAEPNLRWCPRPGCGNAMIGDPQYPRMVCTKADCRKEFCFNCGEDWHQGFTCEQVKQWKVENSKEDAMTAEWTKAHTKPCPKCKALIEKNSGCNHMTCHQCNYQFCWLCGGEYSDNHFSLYNIAGCPGMQFTNGDDMPKSTPNAALAMAKRIGIRLAIGTGMVLGGAVVAALAVPTLLIGGPIFGGIMLHRHQKRRSRRRARRY